MTEAGYKHDRDARGLTAREREVLTLIPLDLSYEEMARRLGLTKQRVGAVVKGLRNKGFLERTEHGTVIHVKGNPPNPQA